MRRHPDGSYWLPKSMPLLEKSLDDTMERIKGETRWFPKNMAPPLKEFQNIAKGKVTIIGKGPSLDNLKFNDIQHQAIFCINDSIKKLHELDHPANVVQQDGSLQDSCIPKNGRHFLSYFARGWNRQAVLYHPACDLDIAPNTPTIIATIKLCLYMGFVEFDLVAFDALKTNKITDYAKIIGYSSRRHKKSPERFFIQTKMVKDALKNYKWKFI